MTSGVLMATVGAKRSVKFACLRKKMERRTEFECAKVVCAGFSDLYRAADTAGVAEYSKVAVDFGRRTRGLFRIIREFHSRPAVD